MRRDIRPLWEDPWVGACEVTAYFVGRGTAPSDPRLINDIGSPVAWKSVKIRKMGKVQFDPANYYTDFHKRDRMVRKNRERKCEKNSWSLPFNRDETGGFPCVFPPDNRSMPSFCFLRVARNKRSDC
ncbi:hypothetical protein JCM17478_26180 [Thermopirellula anaerolimosa]